MSMRAPCASADSIRAQSPSFAAWMSAASAAVNVGSTIVGWICTAGVPDGEITVSSSGKREWKKLLPCGSGANATADDEEDDEEGAAGGEIDTDDDDDDDGSSSLSSTEVAE